MEPCNLKLQISCYLMSLNLNTYSHHLSLLIQSTEVDCCMTPVIQLHHGVPTSNHQLCNQHGFVQTVSSEWVHCLSCHLRLICCVYLSSCLWLMAIVGYRRSELPLIILAANLNSSCCQVEDSTISKGLLSFWTVFVILAIQSPVILCSVICLFDGYVIVSILLPWLIVAFDSAA